ncbi:M48 family metallopeptidase [Nocardioides anomalus]|uniref:M48 family metallopeptidase n=1 Tax=Nocardioides anomalus TaxID=2712223 RepID=A0A6G6WJX3_9ACTN|nr:M48 family metallopeptidase [Nocardioides anomalus]QIG45457.1 M48 family metallopeptidase [Nocardioides anomalus]
MTTSPTRARATLTDISSRAWEHPADRGALVALRKLKGFDTVLRTLSGFMNERRIRLDFLGGGIRVDERQFAGVHRVLAEVGRVLDVEQLPEVYVVNDPHTNAMTIGMDRPVIVLNSALFDLLDEEEMRFVIAHELGHAESGHAVYRTLLLWLMGLTGVWSAVPGGALGLRVLIAALYEWSRKAELSADRAGLLATQDPSVAFRVHMKLASGSGDLSELDQTSFFAQGQEYLETTDLRDSVLKILLNERASHPYAVVRAAELRRWVDSGEYTAILAGSYPRREDDGDASMSEAAKQAADSYSEAFRTSQDVLGKLVHDVAGFFGSAKLWLDEQLRRTRD